MSTPEISEYMRVANGGRCRSFVLDGIRVQVDAHEDDERGRALAEHLASAPAVIERLRAEVVELRAQVPPPRGARLMGPGVIRMLREEIWILSGAAKGWSAFGFRVDSWDELFRRFDVLVTGRSTDATGDYWIVENTKREAESNTEDRSKE